MFTSRASRFKKAIGRAVTVAIVVIIIIIVAAGGYAALTLSKGTTTTTTTTTTSNAVTTSSTTTTSAAATTSSQVATTSNSSTSTSCSSMTSVTYATSFSTAGQYAPSYVAQQEGYFTQNCLNVKIVPGTGTANLIDQLATGQIQFASLQAPSLIEDIAAKTVTNVSMVGMEYESEDYACFYLKNGPFNITSVQSLNGKIITGGSTYYQDILPAVMNVMGIKPASMPPTPGDTGEQELGQGKVAAYCQGAYQEAEVQAVVSSINPSYVVGAFTPEQMGIFFASIGVASGNAFIQAHPAVVTEFLKAYYQGWIYAHQYPSQSTVINVNANPALQYNDSITRLKLALPLVFTPSVYTDGLGYFNMTAFNLTNQIVQQGFNLTGTMPSPSTYISNATWPKVIPPSTINGTTVG